MRFPAMLLLTRARKRARPHLKAFCRDINGALAVVAKAHHRRTCRIFYLEPALRFAGFISQVAPLRNDALQPEYAGMFEWRRAVPSKWSRKVMPLAPLRS